MATSTGPSGRIDGDYELPRGGTLRAPPGSSGIEITGALRSSHSGLVQGSLTCREIRIDDGLLTIQGAVHVSGTVSLRHARLRVEGEFTAGSLEGDKEVSVAGNLDCPDVNIEGQVHVTGATKGDRFEVGGWADLLGTVDLTSLDIGGRVSIGGGTVRRSIEVGGKFETTGSLVFGSLEIGGMAQIRASVQGESVEVGGVIDCDGDLAATHGLEVGGKIRVSGKLKSARIEVGGLLTAGSIEGEEVEVGGRAEVTGAVAARRMEVGGRLSAERVVVTDRVDVGDEIRTTMGIRADSLRVGDRSTVRGPIVAREVTIGDRGEVEDVWAGTLRLRERAQARNIYAEELEVSPRVDIHGETLYVRSIRGEGARFGQSPRQVSQLPPAPL